MEIWDISSIKLSDIDDGNIREITQQEFETFLVEALEITKNTIIKDACNSLE